jgi:Bacterial regulatory proteins, luxR family
MVSQRGGTREGGQLPTLPPFVRRQEGQPLGALAGIRRAASFGSSWTAIVSAAEPVSLRSMCTRPPPGLAKGWTNRQIGQALFITEKTASLHVSHILAKLGVAGRGEAAAVAHRLGLDQQ